MSLKLHLWNFSKSGNFIVFYHIFSIKLSFWWVSKLIKEILVGDNLDFIENQFYIFIYLSRRAEDYPQISISYIFVGGGSGWSNSEVSDWLWLLSLPITMFLSCKAFLCYDKANSLKDKRKYKYDYIFDYLGNREQKVK